MPLRFAIVVFPGTWSDTDCHHAVSGVLGQDAEYVWHQQDSLADYDCVILPGGFSYGDYLRPGAMARLSPVMEAVHRFAASGGLVIGICNGFQVFPASVDRLSTMSLLPRSARLVFRPSANANSVPFVVTSSDGTRKAK